jgi:hypothetical protein
MHALTVCCLFVRGEYPYTVEYVSRLKAMVTRWIDRPFRFVVLTDQPWLMPEDVESIPIQKLSGFAYWTKLELFNPARQWSGRMLYLDLDVLIVAPLQPIIDFPGSFAITADPVKGKQKTRDSFGRQIVRRVNSSVMVWDGGTQTELYTKLTPSVATLLSGDQCWIGLQATNIVGMPRSWFPRLSEIKGPPFGDAKVVLSKHPKNDIAAKRLPWFEEAWA